MLQAVKQEDKKGGIIVTEVILVAHGELADAMKNSAEMIFGELSDFYPIGFTKEDGFDSLKAKIEKQISRLGDSVIILTDLFGGTPFNASSGILMEKDTKQIEVISGMSLPLVLETAAMYKQNEPKLIVEYLQEICKETVRPFVKEEVEEDDL